MLTFFPHFCETQLLQASATQLNVKYLAILSYVWEVGGRKKKEREREKIKVEKCREAFLPFCLTCECPDLM